MVEIIDHAIASDLKAEILKCLKKKTGANIDVEELLKNSVVATNDRVLQDDERLDMADVKSGKRFAVLPPVCGG